MLPCARLLPSCSGRTAERTTLAIGAKNRPIPIPAMMNGTIMASYATVGVTTAASQPSAIA